MGEVILVDVGNSRTKFGVTQGEALGPVTAVETSLLSSAKIPIPKGSRVILASVVPQATEILEHRISRIGADLRVVRHPDECGLEVLYRTKDTLGIDRVLAASAAASVLGQPAVILCAGTAITCDLVDAKRRFVGGAIAPGRRALEVALSPFAPNLPSASAGANPPCPGMETQEAMNLGAHAAFAGTVRELTSRMLECAEGRARLWLSGGDSDLVAALTPELPWTLSRHLVLMGLSALAVASKER